jgi:hypothetical protein
LVQKRKLHVRIENQGRLRERERERERERKRGKKKIDLSKSPPKVVQKDIVLMCVCFSLQSGRHGEDLGNDI